ncbi:MAG: AtpZ/AtpI family protein [Bacteroidales bacterium]|nr:AtpZ/AtpI family protein [Bacteroidales bacterium]
MGEEKRSRRQLKNYARYSGMAFQMGIIIAAGAYGGIKLDEKWNTKPWMTLVCVLLAIAVALYSVIKDLVPPKNNK